MTARVVLLTTGLARGGAETQVAHLAIELRRRGWDVTILSLRQPSFFTSELATAGVPLLAPGLPRVPVAIARLRPHILHSHMFHANVAARLLRLILPVPAVISTVHSIMESSRGSTTARSRDLVYRLTDYLADVIVSVSDAAAQRHIAAGAAARAKTRVIGNGINAALFRPHCDRRQSIRETLGWRNQFVWLAVGRLMWKKDYPTLLAAFARLPDGILAIAGTGPDEQKLRQIAPPATQFLGARDDVPDLMAAADAFVLSSVVEGLPLVLLEAFASGLVCVGTDVGGVQETGPVILVPPRNPEALATAMRQVMAMPETERQRRGDMARMQVTARFAWPVVVQQWEALYGELLPWM